MESRAGIADCLEAIAGIRVSEREWEEAAVLYAAAQAIRGELGTPRRPGAGDPAREEHLGRLRVALDEPALARAWAEGSGLALRGACERALGPSPGAGGAPGPPSSEP
jgi:hypothetical protein